MEVKDSRRFTGPNVLWQHPGAVLEVALQDAQAAGAIETWRANTRRCLDALDWKASELTQRTFPGGISVALSAPVDALYAATEVNEFAWDVTQAQLEDRAQPDWDSNIARLASAIAKEQNPALIRLGEAAAKHAVTFLSDDDEVSVGRGSGSLTFPVQSIPTPEQVDWDGVHDIPTALVTGTNGKTTTVRLLAAMVKAEGKICGLSSTDWLRIGDKIIDRGDWSGPGGGRTILRNREVDIAILETARGGMLRRGLAVESAEVALITNVAEDHLGEWGVLNLDMLADTKFVVAHAAKTLVLNADNESVRVRGEQLTKPVTWFSLDDQHEHIRAARAAGLPCAYLESNSSANSEELVWSDTHGRQPIAAVSKVPMTLDGAARHNVANALGAISVAKHLGLSDRAIRTGLSEFHCDPQENPGRLNLFEIDGFRALVDFAHNPHGFEAFFEMAGRLQAKRKLVLLGQAGDRTDKAILELVRIAWHAKPDHFVIKEMLVHLRGRSIGEVPALIQKELMRLGADASQITHAPSELDGVRWALDWARPGDCLLLLTHAEREAVLELMSQRAQAQ